MGILPFAWLLVRCFSGLLAAHLGPDLILILRVRVRVPLQAQLRSDISKELRIKEGAENMRRAVQDPNRRSAHDRRALEQLHKQIKTVNSRLQDLQQELADLDAQMLMASQFEFEDEQTPGGSGGGVGVGGGPGGGGVRVVLRPPHAPGPVPAVGQPDDRDSGTGSAKSVAFGTGTTNGVHTCIEQFLLPLLISTDAA